MSYHTSTRFGRLLRVRRLSADVTLSEVASKVGCSVSFVSDVENGRRNPFTKNQIKRITELVGMELREGLIAAAEDVGYLKVESSSSTVLALAADLAIYLDTASDRRLALLRIALEDLKKKP